MPNNDNKKRHPLYQSWMSPSDFQFYKDMYGTQTARPKYVPSSDTMDMVDNVLYPSTNDYMASQMHLTPKNYAVQEFDVYVMPTELREYSLKGLESITDRDLDKCLRELDEKG